MIPSSLFYDLIDSQIAFKIVQRNFNSPNFIFSVPRAKDGQLRMTILGGQALVGSADAILARLNALLCAHPSSQPQHSFRQVADNGKVITYSLFPEGEKSKHHGMPEELSVECRIMPADDPSSDRETVIVNVIIDGRHSLHLMEKIGNDNFQEVSRLSAHALPKDVHQRLAANGYYQQSFVALYGEEALEEAKSKLKATGNRWARHNVDPPHARH